MKHMSCYRICEHYIFLSNDNVAHGDVKRKKAKYYIVKYMLLEKYIVCYFLTLSMPPWRFWKWGWKCVWSTMLVQVDEVTASGHIYSIETSDLDFLFILAVWAARKMEK